MPSGAKKRKALAKKKKDKQQSNTTNTSHGDNDLVKTHERDGAEVGSGGSQDHRNKDAPSVRSNGDESTVVEVVHIDGDSTREIDSEGKDVKKVHSRSSSSSSSNSGSGSNSHGTTGSSDDEFQFTEKLELEPEILKEETFIPITDDSVEESGPAIDSIKLVEAVFEKMTPVTENNGVAELSTHKTDDQLAVPSLGESTGASVPIIDIESKKMEYKSSPFSCANDVVTKENGDKLVQSSSNAPVNEGRAQYSDIPECSENQPLLAGAPPRAQKTSWKSCCGLFDF